MQSADVHKPDDAVQAALRKVNEAVYTAEKQLDKLDKLPSARMSRQVCSLLAAVHQSQAESNYPPFYNTTPLHSCILSLVDCLYEGSKGGGEAGCMMKALSTRMHALSRL